MKVNNKELIDSNIDELDENLRKQWPRKGKLEVEIYQERKSQITAHNKKYERQVRQCLERHNKSEEMWVYLMDTINREFENYFKQQEKLKGNISDCKNLAELQGNSRKERDSVQSFEEKIVEITDKLYDIAVAQSDSLIKLNCDMLKSCQLFEQGGNYSELEVEWYKTQMDEINEMLQSFRKEKEQELADVNDRLQKSLKQPYEEFEDNYKSGMHKLVTKEGLGKKFGAPRRIIQEKMRAEMTKCEQAQSGIEKLLDKLNQLCSGDWVGDQATSSLSIEIRKVQICIMRCIVKYGKYLHAFRIGDEIIRELKELTPLTLTENKNNLELTEEEQKNYDERLKRELFHLNIIGASQEENANFSENILKINNVAIEHCQKLYVGEDAQWLVGEKKIPEYLSIYLKGVNEQAEQFRIQSIRYLRDSALELIKIDEKVPNTVFSYIEEKYSRTINTAIANIEKTYSEYEREDKELRASHLKRFRPNLANPANAGELEELNKEAKERTDKFIEKVDDTQVQLVDLEIEKSNEFYVVYFNNLRCLLKLFDALVYREHFIKLPGDEIVVKKKLNIRILKAKYQGHDLTTQPKRKWKGLGPNPFKVDLTKYESFADLVQPDEEKAPEEVEKQKGRLFFLSY
jgi:golgin subfamily A member 4